MTNVSFWPGAGFRSSSMPALAAIALLTLLPIAIFGHPGFYGDDLNLRGALDQGGLAGAMGNWIEHYGLGYRPGMAISFGLYDLIGDRPGLFYFINAAAFLAIAVALHNTLAALTGDRMLAVFAGAFFALFPLSSTAHLQLSSICMFLAILVLVPLTGLLLAASDRCGTWPRAWTVGALWAAVLLVYEQPIGLYAFFAVALVAAVRVGCAGHSAAAVFRLGVAVTVCTSLFLAGYFMNSGNPKVVSLKSIRDQNVAAATPLPDGGKAGLAAAPAAPSATDEAGARDAASPDQRSRAAKLLTFFVRNAGYALESMASAPWALAAFIALLAVAGGAILRMPAATVTRRAALGYLAFGLLWALLSILPFFLYGRFSAPPYVFVLPSIGIGVAAYGACWAVLPASFGARHGGALLKTLAVGMVAFFALQQYGYFFGLREELQYSRSLAERLRPHKHELLDGAVLRLDGLPAKPHEHIFWLWKAVGYRAFFTAMGDEFAGIETRWRDAGSLEVSIPKRSPTRPLVMFLKY